MQKENQGRFVMKNGFHSVMLSIVLLPITGDKEGVRSVVET